MNVSSEQCEEVLIYSSSVPESICPPPKGIVRATNVFTMARITKLWDGRTVYKWYSQIDPNFYMNAFYIFRTVVGSKTRQWYNSIIEHIKSKYDDCESLDR